MHLDKVVSDLYAAANGRTDWQTALGQVAEHLGLLLVQVLGIDKRNTQLVFSSVGGRVSPQASLDYFRYYNTIDPRTPVALATPPEGWMHCHEHFDEGYVAGSEFYQDFLLPYGGRYVSATRLIDNAEVLFFVAMHRGQGSLPLGPQDLPQLQQLKHHFTEAFHNFVHLRETYAELGMARELLGQFPEPMLLVDETGSIWHRNAGAQALLAQRDPVLDQNGYLSCVTRANQQALAEALHSLDLTAPPEPGRPPRRRAVSLPRAQGGRLLAFVSAVRPETAMGAFGRLPAALVILHDPLRAQPPAAALDPLILGECFALTPAEARVAVQIAGGVPVKEVARRSGTALPTVRSQLSSILHKTGVARQADLVRVLLDLPLRA